MTRSSTGNTLRNNTLGRHVAVKSRPLPSPRERGRSLAILVIIVLGFGVFLYPTAADWFSRLNHNNEITGYQQSLGGLSEEARSEALMIADEYNSRMPDGPLRDPFAYESANADSDAGYVAYENLLKVSASGVIGRIQFAELGIDLPIYHGTDDEVISKGAGHLYGSSLPVGGPSTHSVLTAHSGLPTASLFTSLHDVEIGDEFWIEVLGEKHWYRVENTAVVEPNDLSEMQIIKNKDYVTLFTCTPVGVNSHRFLVRGERIEAPPAVAGSIQSEVVAGFPWWVLILLGGTGTAAWLLFRQGQSRNDSSPPEVSSEHQMI